MKYTLVNPFITGNIDITHEDKNALNAAKTLYTRVSKHFKNNLPRFFFSLVDSNNKMIHFEVNEKKIGKEVSFTIKQAQMKKAGEKKIMNVVSKKIEQLGGAKDDSSSDSSSSSDDSSSTSPYQLPYYVNPLRELLYYPSDYIIEVYDTDYVIDYPYGVYIPTGADYVIIG